MAGEMSAPCPSQVRGGSDPAYRRVAGAKAGAHANLAHVPPELIEDILKFLDDRSAFAMSEASSSLRCTVRNADQHWNSRYAQRWGGRRLHDIVDPSLGVSQAHALRLMGLDSWHSAFRVRMADDVELKHNWISGRHVGRKLRGHRSEVFCALQKGPVLLSASQDCTIRLWDLKSTARLAVFREHQNWASCLCAEEARPGSVYSGGVSVCPVSVCRYQRSASAVLHGPPQDTMAPSARGTCSSSVRSRSWTLGKPASARGQWARWPTTAMS